MLTLRPYQQAAQDALYAYLADSDGNPCVVLPTGSGKTPLIASVSRDAVEWQSRVMILQHSKELIAQTRDHLLAVDPLLPVGVFSAGLKSRDRHYAVTVAGIHSVYNRGEEFGTIDLLIIDEAHLIPHEDDGMYRTLIATLKALNPNLRIIAFTATPYRLKGGLICGSDSVITEIVYEAGIPELVDAGYLAPLRTKKGTASANMAGVTVRAGEFVASAVEERMQDVVERAVDEVIRLSKDRTSVLVFTASIKHGERVTELLKKRSGATVEFIEGNTLHRDAIIERFKRRETKFLVNVNVLTTGFDARNVDCVAIMRATMSPGLWVQMVGRGSRTCEGKADCLILDYGSNAERHGPIDEVLARQRRARMGGGGGDPVVKECPYCHEIVAGGCAKCPACGWDFPITSNPSHGGSASEHAVLGSANQFESYDITDVDYNVHYKRGNSEAPRTLRVTYWSGTEQVISEWVCVEHEQGSFAHRKAVEWWNARTDEQMPSNAEEAKEVAAGFNKPTRITIRRKPDEEWPRIVACAIERKVRPATALFEGVGPCRECENEDQVWVRQLGPQGWQEVCGWCGAFRRMLASTEAQQHVEDEIPF